MASLCLYNWRIFLIMKEVSKVSTTIPGEVTSQSHSCTSLLSSPAPPPTFHICTFFLSISVARISCRNTMVGTWTCAYCLIQLLNTHHSAFKKRISFQFSNILYIPRLHSSRFWYCNENCGVMMAAAAAPGSSLGLCILVTSYHVMAVGTAAHTSVLSCV